MPWRSLALAVLLPLGACGTLASQFGHRVAVDSDPSGATVLRGRTVVGVTPCEVEVAVDDRVLELRLAGHQARSFELPLVANPWVAGNVSTFGVGMVVDELCGADRVPCTAPLSIRLLPGSGCAAIVRVRPDVQPRREAVRTGDPRAPSDAAETAIMVAYWFLASIRP